MYVPVIQVCIHVANIPFFSMLTLSDISCRNLENVKCTYIFFSLNSNKMISQDITFTLSPFNYEKIKQKVRKKQMNVLK